MSALTKDSKMVVSYIETALWSSTDDNGQPLDKSFDASDLSEQAIERAVKDCTSFLEENKELYLNSGYNLKDFGHNFWLSRNGHGAGFFDEGENELQDASRMAGECDLYIGDDGFLYFS